VRKTWDEAKEGRRCLEEVHEKGQTPLKKGRTTESQVMAGEGKGETSNSNAAQKDKIVYPEMKRQTVGHWGTNQGKRRMRSKENLTASSGVHTEVACHGWYNSNSLDSFKHM